MHGSQNPLGGDLRHDTVTIIGATLDLQDKTVRHAMTSINKVFMLHIDSKLDYDTLRRICSTGHSRIPVYEEVEVRFIRSSPGGYTKSSVHLTQGERICARFYQLRFFKSITQDHDSRTPPRRSLAHSIDVFTSRTSFTLHTNSKPAHSSNFSTNTFSTRVTNDQHDFPTAGAHRYATSPTPRSSARLR